MALLVNKIGQAGNVETGAAAEPASVETDAPNESRPAATAEEHFVDNPVGKANRDAAKDARADAGGVPGGLPPGAWNVASPPVSPLVQQTIDELSELPQVASREVAVEAFGPFAEQVYPVEVRGDLSEELAAARGRYAIDGVPRIVNRLIAGETEEASHPGWVWGLLGQNKQEWEGVLNDLFAFSLTSPLVKPKIVFHATERTFEPGQTIDAFLSATEQPEFAGHYLEHPGETRRVVAFVLNGTPELPARAGMTIFDGWNEVVIPPHFYEVAGVEQTGFGEVVTLQPRGVDIAGLRSWFAARMRDTVPEEVDLEEFV
jgi:hypothetical protein